jgi:tetratricopeptide (TPR) repeat protein
MLMQHAKLVDERDDLSVELAALLNQAGKPHDALSLLLRRRFQPWEGGEGLVLGQYVRARLLLGWRNLNQDEPAKAREQFFAALEAPESLGEAKHLLANQSDIYYWMAESFHRESQEDQARAWWLLAAEQRGDFQQMSVREVSDMTFWTGAALQSLGRAEEATVLFDRIYDYSVELEKTEPVIDYFAASLPAMLLFDENLGLRNRIQALFLRAQASLGHKRRAVAEDLLREVLAIDGSHAGACDLLRQLADFDIAGAVH